MVFGMLKFRKDKKKLTAYIKEHKDYFENIDAETFDAAVAMLGAGKLIDSIKNEESGKRNMCKAIDDIYNDGITAGKAEGKAEDILELLRTVGEVSDNLREIIYAQKDLQTLNAWFRTAVRVDSIAEFESVVGGGRAVLRKM